MRQRYCHRQRTEPIPQIAGGFWVFFLCLSLPELCSLELVQWEHRALVPHAVSTVFGHLPPSASAKLYFGTVNWFLCFLWADKNLSFSKVLVFKLCKSFFFFFFHWIQWVSWRANSREAGLLMPLEGDTLTGLMVANLSLSLIELISGVMGWAQSPSSFPQHWQPYTTNRLTVWSPD